MKAIPTRPPLLVDLEAEKGLLSCMAENIRPPELDPAEITSDCLRVLYLTAASLMDSQILLFPADYGNAGDCIRTAEANCEIIAHNVDAAGTWPGADSPRWMLHQCLQVASLPWLVDYYANRIKEAARRRQILERGQELQRLALSPGPLGEVAA